MSATHRRTELLAGIGAEVRALRESRGWTQRTLAEASGLSGRYLAQLEAGQANVSVERLADLAEALEVELTSLFEHAPGPQQPVIALLGVRGAGKSSVGRRLAARLSVPFIELDQLIERAAGLKLAEIFELHGEAYYRRLAREVLQGLHLVGGAVVATGGSLVNDRETYHLLKRRATTVWLRARPEDHWNRVIQQGDRRPMAEHPEALHELRALMTARASLYAEADHTIDTSSLSIDDTVSRLAATLAA